MSHIDYEKRYAVSPKETAQMNTNELRRNFLIEGLFVENKIKLTYSHFDRYIAGGVFPVAKALSLDTIDPLKSEHFLDRRELGVINIGGDGIVTVDGEKHELAYKDALYVGMGSKEVLFESKEASKPAKFYINSAPAHQSFPVKKISKSGR